jgi:GTPase Era involved in 16S rRNA processing
MDAAVVLADARRVEEHAWSPAAGKLREAFSGKPVILALTFVDYFPPALAGALVNQAGLPGGYDSVVAVCPPRGGGVKALLDAVAFRMPARRRLFPENCRTLHAERFLVAEAIRTELFNALSPEIASTTAVQIEEFSLRDTKTYVRANLYVSRHASKGVVIGRKGQNLQRITDLAASAAGTLTGRNIALDLWVKVRESWPENPHDLLEFGYVC